MTLCAFSIVWLTNLYNFMDGSNGMAGLQGLFVSLVLAFLFHSSGDSQYALYALILAGCCFGFLPWNLGHAKVFMGDVGSLALGFLMAALFLLVVLAALGLVAVKLSVVQHHTVSLTLQSARAFQAAQSAIEYGAYLIFKTTSLSSRCSSYIN